MARIAWARSLRVPARASRIANEVSWQRNISRATARVPVYVRLAARADGSDPLMRWSNVLRELMWSPGRFFNILGLSFALCLRTNHIGPGVGERGGGCRYSVVRF